MTQNPLTIRLPDELAEALRTYAFVTHTSANGIVEAALTEYLKAPMVDMVASTSRVSNSYRQ